MTNCLICQTASSCQVCNVGFTVNLDGTCGIICGVRNCLACTSSQCTNCASGFTLSTNGLSCNPACGLYATSFSYICLECSAFTPYCKSCTAVNTSSIICTSCLDSSLLPNSTCYLCSSYISNCFSCRHSLLCDICNPGFTAIVSKGLSCQPLSTVCSIAFCQSCVAQTNCVSCIFGYQLNNSQCQSVSIRCSNNQIFNGSACTCASYSYLNGDYCVDCSSNCTRCSAFAC